MSQLLDTYNRMLNAGQEKVAAEEMEARVEFLTKVASSAEEMLTAEYGDDYDANDVIELSQLIIDDLANNEKTAEELEASENLELEEKVAELYEMGAIIAQGFKAELSRED